MPMSLFDHFVVDISIRHKKALKVASSLPPSALTGRTAGEAELSKLSIDMIQQLHHLSAMVAKLGAEAVFRQPSAPIEPEKVAEILKR